MTTQQFVKNEKAFGGSYVVILAVLIFGAFIVVMLHSFFNELLSVGDTLASQGMVTERLHSYYNDNTNLIKFLPVIITFGLLGWGFVYAIEHRT